jgi:hypothetical protein
MASPLRLAGRLAVAVLLAASAVSAQPQVRRATNAAALVAFPGFYHQRPVTLFGSLKRTDDGQLHIVDAPPALKVVYTGHVPDEPSEIRGEFWDIGRMRAEDPRLASYDLKSTFGFDPDAGWPRVNQVPALILSGIESAPPPAPSTIRAVVLQPSRYLDQKITLTGQFAGRNLLGDLPDAPGRTPYDFVVRSADSAVWVTNLRPRGRDFELSLDTRVDTGRWVEVTGTLQEGRGLQWLNAEGSRIALVKEPSQPNVVTSVEPVSVTPPPEVLFSAPTQDETDVSQTGSVRIQFSRDINPGSLTNRIRVRYLDEEARLQGEPDAPVAKFTYQYTAANRVLEIKFADPLVRYRTIKVDLLEGIVGTDKQPLAPWTLSFVTAGAL